MARIATDMSPSDDAGSGASSRAERSQPLQETFLSHVCANKVPLTVFLLNGVKRQGVVTAFDAFCLLLTRGADSLLVYKHAISSIAPLSPIQLHEREERPDDKSASEPAPRRPLVEIRRRR
jgi:host factor-I protein